MFVSLSPNNSLGLGRMWFPQFLYFMERQPCHRQNTEGKHCKQVTNAKTWICSCKLQLCRQTKITKKFFFPIPTWQFVWVSLHIKFILIFFCLLLWFPKWGPGAHWEASETQSFSTKHLHRRDRLSLDIYIHFLTLTILNSQLVYWHCYTPFYMSI